MMLAERLLKREKALEMLLLFFSKTELEVSHYSLLFSSVVEKAANDLSVRSLGFVKLCDERIKNGEDFPKAWKESIMQKPPPISKAEKEKLVNFAFDVSSCDKDGVIKTLDYYRETFELSLSDAKQTRKKYARLCICSGIFIGGIIFITLI